MKTPLSLRPVPNTETLEIRSADFTGLCTYRIPEAIGPVEDALWDSQHPGIMHPTWEEDGTGGWRGRGGHPGALDYTVQAKALEDTIDVEMRLTNRSQTAWTESLSFSCFTPRAMTEFADFDGTRTFLLLNGRWTPLTRIERRDSNRPTIQLWYVQGKPHPLRFVENFRANPPVIPAGILAVRSYDGRHILAVTADRPLCLFSNLEFSCIHCCPSYGALGPGEVGRATHRVYLCQDTTLEALAARAHAFWKG